MTYGAFVHEIEIIRYVHSHGLPVTERHIAALLPQADSIIAERNELLEALQAIVDNWHPHGTYQKEYLQAQAAIEKAS